MKKEIGMITIHYVDNIGGVLLAYALQEVIDRFGYDCRVIDYDPTPLPSMTSYLAKTILRRVGRTPHYFLNFGHYFKMLTKHKGSILPPRHKHGSSGLRKKRFDSFRQKYIKLSEKHYTSSASLNEFPPRNDAYVCGSDQVWNPFICKTPEKAKNEPAYFLTFAPEPKRVSYAPSISIPKIPEKFRAEMAALLHGIPYLSCREKQGAELIRELTGRDAEVVLDPTLLLDRDQWDQITVNSALNEPYILCYFLGEGLDYRDFARKLSRETGYRLVVISRDDLDMLGSSTISRSDSGPAEFLGLVKNASCVCTDSFHGTIFSINFGVPFYTFERPGSSGSQSMASRIYNILDLLGLTARMIQADMLIPDAPLQIDYSRATVLLQKEREKSLHYLEGALQQASSHQRVELSDVKGRSRQ